MYSKLYKIAKIDIRTLKKIELGEHNISLKTAFNINYSTCLCKLDYLVKRNFKENSDGSCYVLFYRFWR